MLIAKFPPLKSPNAFATTDSLAKTVATVSQLSVSALSDLALALSKYLSKIICGLIFFLPYRSGDKRYEKETF